MDASTRKAAILLWKVMKTASKEVIDNTNEEVVVADSQLESAVVVPMSSSISIPRPRLVSIGSQDTAAATTPRTSPHNSPMTMMIHPISPLLSSSPLPPPSSSCGGAVVVPMTRSLDDFRRVRMTATATVTTFSRSIPDDNEQQQQQQQAPSTRSSRASSSASSSMQQQQQQHQRKQLSETDDNGCCDLAASDATAGSANNSNKVLTMVGQKNKTRDHPVKAILRKKFAWKNYPELENFLINHRTEYLQYSSSLNYTAEQKRYNNTLTNGLLELAEQHGYIFDDFTFPMVRDRIRCYYKSYVQAARKKQRRHS